MSVINQMLKDLESRRQTGGNGNDVLDGVGWHASSSSGKRLPLLGILVLLLAGVVAWLVYERSNVSQVINDGPVSAAETRPAQTSTTPPAREQQPATPGTAAMEGQGEHSPEAGNSRQDIIDEADVPEPASAAIEADTDPAISEYAIEPEIHEVSPEPVPGTGRRSRIVVRGNNFTEPLDVFVSWGDGDHTKQLDDKQVRVDNEGTLTLFINPGTETDDWTVRVVSAGGRSSSQYAFRVVSAGNVADKQVSRANRAVPTEQPNVIKKERRASPVERATKLYNKARTELSHGDLAQGEASLRNALSELPSMHTARKLLAGMLLREGRSIEAAKVLDEGLALAPAHTGFILLRARIYTEQGDIAAATGLLESQQPPLQTAADYYALLAALYQRSNRHAAAANLYTNMLKLNPGQAVWHMGLGISLEALGKNKKAREAYESALQSGLKDDDVRNFVRSRLRGLQ